MSQMNFGDPMDNSLTSTVTGIDKPKHWAPDQSATNCAVCDSKFSFVYRRRHHCRQCGGCVCNKCSQDREYVPGYKDKKVRVCAHCSQAKLEVTNKIMTARVNSALSATTLIKPPVKKPAKKMSEA